MSKTVRNNVFASPMASIYWMLSEVCINESDGNYMLSNAKFDNYANCLWMQKMGFIEKFQDKNTLDSDGFAYKLLNIDIDKIKEYLSKDSTAIRIYKYYKSWIEKSNKKEIAEKRTTLTGNEMRDTIDGISEVSLDAISANGYYM